MTKVQETVLEIYLDALSDNLKYLKSKLKPGTKFMAVVKAFGYGSDAVVIAKHLQENNIDYLAVAYAQEGVALRQAGLTLPILVLHPQMPNLKTLIDYCLEPSLYSFKILRAFLKIAKNQKQSHYPVHIKFNTGLNRLGFLSEDAQKVASIIIPEKAITIKSVFSHLAASEDINERTFTLQQISSFKAIGKSIGKSLGYRPWMHVGNTSGILNYPEAHFDMVRSGIGLYGFGNSATENKNLKPIASLKSVVSQIHEVSKNCSVGYNRAFFAQETTRTATIPIGHADGLGRQYGNGKGYVYINGQKAPIIGHVCMDMLMVNVSKITCQEGDEVIIFNDVHTAETLAESAGTISYELITAISSRVKRKIFGKK